MWIGVYMAQDAEVAEKVRETLENKGVLARVKENGNSFEILVPSTEVDEAHEIILDLF